jgi:hypothetical protein
LVYAVLTVVGMAIAMVLQVVDANGRSLWLSEYGADATAIERYGEGDIWLPLSGYWISVLCC